MNSAEQTVRKFLMEYSAEELRLIFNRMGMGMYGEVSEEVMIMVRDRRDQLEAAIAAGVASAHALAALETKKQYSAKRLANGWYIYREWEVEKMETGQWNFRPITEGSWTDAAATLAEAKSQIDRQV